MASNTRSGSTYKPIHLDIPLHELPFNEAPSAFDTALSSPGNGDSKQLKNPDFLDPEHFRRLSLSTLDGLIDDGRGRSPSQVSNARCHSPAPPPKTWKAWAVVFWQRNRGLYLVALSQFFGALMNVTTRMLELEGDGMDPFQIVFARMGITVLCCCAYMWYTSVAHFPFGQRGVRGLLVVRGLSGFFGLFGIYYSLQYLPIADAVVITFLAPGVASLICYFLLGEKFTRVEQIATIVSLLGVVLIARPTSFFHTSDTEGGAAGANADAAAANSTEPTSHDFHTPNPTSAQRLTAIAVALLGVLGAAGAYTTIRIIGKRAHPLISVNYFATWCTIVATGVLTVEASVPRSSWLHSDFKLPSTFRQWGFLFALGTCGFIMQFMLTAGLAHEKSNRANNMIYTQMLFALLFDRWVFGTVPNAWSLVGSAMILGSAVYVAVQKSGPPVEEVVDVRGTGGRDEEAAMLRDMDEDVRRSEEGEGITRDQERRA